MDDMDTPQISRSGRVLKKSAKVKEMEDFDINELDGSGKPRKRSRTSDEFDEFDDKRVAPLKIPKISLGMSGSASPVKRPPQMMQKMVKPKQFYPDSDASKESDSSSVTSETSSSSSASSDDSDAEEYRSQEKKVVVEPPYRQFESPAAFVEHRSMEGSDEDEESDSLVIAEDRGRGKRPPPRRGGAVRKRPQVRVKKEKVVGAKSKPLTAYMLWCTENRKRIVASYGNIGLGNIGKKLGEAWQALPDKEKMAWRRKAKRLAMKGSSGLISTGPTPRGRTPTPAAAIIEDPLKGEISTRALGTAAIDTAAYLKLLGDSLSVIGQRLTEHEGQLAVSGIFSVLLDTILCVVGPLLCLTSESPTLKFISPDLHKKTLDTIAYFMPGL